MTNSSSIAQLQSDWFKFSDLDRASAVQLAVELRSLEVTGEPGSRYQNRLRTKQMRYILHDCGLPIRDRRLRDLAGVQREKTLSQRNF